MTPRDAVQGLLRALERIEIGDVNVHMEWSRESEQREADALRGIAKRALAAYRTATLVAPATAREIAHGYLRWAANILHCNGTGDDCRPECQRLTGLLSGATSVAMGPRPAVDSEAILSAVDEAARLYYSGFIRLAAYRERALANIAEVIERASIVARPPEPESSTPGRQGTP